jgi:hypothetical protein
MLHSNEEGTANNFNDDGWKQIYLICVQLIASLAIKLEELCCQYLTTLLFMSPLHAMQDYSHVTGYPANPENSLHVFIHTIHMPSHNDVIPQFNHNAALH